MTSLAASEIYHSKCCPDIRASSSLKAALFGIDSAAREKQKSLTSRLLLRGSRSVRPRRRTLTSEGRAGLFG